MLRVTFNLKRNTNMKTTIILTSEEVKAAIQMYLFDKGVEYHGEMILKVFSEGDAEVSF